MDEDATRMPQVGCKQTQLGILISYKIHRNTAKPKIHILRTRFLELRIHSSTPVPWEVEHGPGLDFGEHLWRSPNPGNEALGEAGHGRSFRYSSSLLQGAKAFQQRARKSKACHLSSKCRGSIWSTRKWSIEYWVLHLPYKYQAFLSCVCTLIFSVKVHKTMNFVAVQKQRQSQWRRYTGVVVLQFYGKSSASLVLQYCLYSIVWHVFLYKARVVIRKKSPTSPIISLSRHSFQRPKGQSLPRCERWINPSWLSNSAFWKKCFEQKGCQLNTQSHQPKRTPIRSQRCDVYFSSPSSTVVTSKEQGFVILEMFSTYQAGLAISWTLVSSEFCQRWTH